MSIRMGTYVWALVFIGVLAAGAGCSKAPNDSAVSEQIHAKLNQDSGLQGKSITVQTSGGVVTLTGTVDNDTQRAAAAQYASTIPGVRTVVNDLQVAAAAPMMGAANQMAGAASPTPATPAPSTLAPTTPATVRPEATPRPGAARHQGKADSSDLASSRRSGPGSSESDSANAETAVVANQVAANQADANPVSSQAAPATPPPAPKMLTIQSGTLVSIRLVDAIDSESAQAGQTFRATLDAPLSLEWEVAIPTGYNVEGHVVEAKSAGKFAGQSELVLQLDRIMVGDKSYSVQTDQYRREGKNRTTNTAEKVGAGAVLGAIIGGIAGGGKGAGIGAAAGGGVGGGVQAATKGQQIKLPSETVLNFTLQSPLTVTQVEQGPESGRPRLKSTK